jgi:hypothetical protein
MVYVTNHLQMTPAGRRAGLIRWVIYIPWWLKKKNQGMNPLFFGTPYSLALLPRHMTTTTFPTWQACRSPIQPYQRIHIYLHIHGWTDTTTTRPASPSVRMLPRLTPEHLQSSSPPPAPTTIRHLSRQGKTAQQDKTRQSKAKQPPIHHRSPGPSAPNDTTRPQNRNPADSPSSPPRPLSIHPPVNHACTYVRTTEPRKAGACASMPACLPVRMPVRMPTLSTAVAHPASWTRHAATKPWLAFSLSLSFPFPFLDHKGLRVRGRT